MTEKKAVGENKAVYDTSYEYMGWISSSNRKIFCSSYRKWRREALIGQSHLQHPLRTDYIACPNLTSHSPGARRPNGHGQGLERALGPVVVVGAVRAAHMQRDTCRLRKALQPVGYHLRAQVPDLLPLEAEVDHCIRPV